MAAERRDVSGFTLIELLITIVVLSMVVGIASFAFSLFSGYWGARTALVAESKAHFQRWDLLSTALSDTIPWLVRSEQGVVGFYFLGRPDGLTLVTESPIVETGAPAVIRLFAEKERDGSFSLFYEEAPLTEVRLQDADQKLPFRYRMLIADKLQRISFKYFGWSSLQERLEAADGFRQGGPTWATSFDGLKASQHPDRIGISLDSFEAFFPVTDRAPISLRRSLQE
jgi:prepilin-type N-terminal cleavage/methylation domain-containing protein